MTAANLPRPSGGRLEHCRYCPDDGWVVADRGTAPQTAEDFEQLHKLREANPTLKLYVYGEALAPCPHCEQGHANEFSGYYGEEGFWRGRDELKAQLQPLPPNPPLSQGEGRRRAQELAERLGMATEGRAP